MSDKLNPLPCPHCGGPVTVTNKRINNDDHGHMWDETTKIKCAGCGSTTKYSDNEWGAITTWNNRVDVRVIISREENNNER